VAGRYATALYELAEAERALDVVANDFKRIRAILGESADFGRFLASPVLGRGAQGKAVAAIAERAALHPLSRKFLGVLARNRRLTALPDIISTFLAELAARRGEVVAEVTSAQPLAPPQLAALTDSLRATLGGKVTVQTRVDSDLLGGLAVRIGSRMIDASLRSKLQRLRLAMKGIG
jgi:F-type H+-transporting ATPase subunit delta